MPGRNTFPVNPGWRVLLTDMGLNPGNILRRAELPGDLFGREKAALNSEEYFRLWRAIEEEAQDPALPLRVADAISAEMFDPPIFAALCSPDLNTALARLATYKRLICPMKLHVKVGRKATSVEVEWLDTSFKPPASLVGTEIVFFVQLARIATRTRMCPVAVTAPSALEPTDAYVEYLGVTARRGPRPIISFKREDAELPFVTANEAMWKTFEPTLRERLSEVDESATTVDRVRAALLELLPVGNPSVEAVSDKLGTSKRTLQRWLNQENQKLPGSLERHAGGSGAALPEEHAPHGCRDLVPTRIRGSEFVLPGLSYLDRQDTRARKGSPPGEFLIDVALSELDFRSDAQ